MRTLIVEKDRLLTERQALLLEKDVLAEELQHRVRNNLQLVSGMLRQQIDTNDGGPKEGLRSIAQRVMSLAKVYDHLLGNGLSRVVDFDRYTRSLCESLSAFQGARNSTWPSLVRARLNLCCSTSILSPRWASSSPRSSRTPIFMPSPDAPVRFAWL
jgi:two-component sensor histidine kinase